MNSEDYKSLDVIKKFNFSFDMVNKTKVDIKEQHDAVKDRIDKIVNHFTIDDYLNGIEIKYLRNILSHITKKYT